MSEFVIFPKHIQIKYEPNVKRDIAFILDLKRNHTMFTSKLGYDILNAIRSKGIVSIEYLFEKFDNENLLPFIDDLVEKEKVLKISEEGGQKMTIMKKPQSFITIAGTSMAPLILPGDTIYAERTEYYEIQKGDIVTAIRWDGKAIMHRVLNIDSNQFQTIGDDKPLADCDILIPENIFGVVKGFIPNNAISWSERITIAINYLGYKMKMNLNIKNNNYLLQRDLLNLIYYLNVPKKIGNNQLIMFLRDEELVDLSIEELSEYHKLQEFISGNNKDEIRDDILEFLHSLKLLDTNWKCFANTNFTTYCNKFVELVYPKEEMENYCNDCYYSVYKDLIW